MTTSIIKRPEVPCAIPIPEGVFVGRRIRIQGVVHQGVDEFTINLQTGPSFGYEDNIALHLRFCFMADEPCVIRNYLYQNEWGSNEISNEVTLRQEVDFEIIITCEAEEFKVHIDGVNFCSFPCNRVPLETVRYLMMQGDYISISNVMFEGEPTSDTRMFLAPLEDNDFRLQRPSVRHSPSMTATPSRRVTADTSANTDADFIPVSILASSAGLTHNRVNESFSEMRRKRGVSMSDDLKRNRYSMRMSVQEMDRIVDRLNLPAEEDDTYSGPVDPELKRAKCCVVS